MKRLIVFILCLSFVFAPVCVFAGEYPEETLIIMGDVNGDGKVVVADARIALRMAVDIESKEGVELLRADTDADGSITVADARNVLRKSVSLADFSTGFDGNGVANALNVLKLGRYTISAKAEDMEFLMAVDGENIYLTTSDFSFSFGSQLWENLGVMYLDGTFYVSFFVDGKEYAWQFTDAAIELMFGAAGDAASGVDEIFEITKIISGMLPEKFDIPELAEEDGETVFIYKSTDDVGSEFVVDARGCLKKICDYDSNGKLSYCMDIESFSAESYSDYFDLSRFEEIQLF